MKDFDKFFDKLFTRKASEFVNRHGEREEEREVKIPEHMLPPPRRKRKDDDDDENENAGAAGKNKGEGTTTNGSGGGGSNDATISEQILTAYKNQNYFKALAVAEPTSDEIGIRFGPKSYDLSKASEFTHHPDKNPNDEAEKVRRVVRRHQKLKNEETKRGVESIREEGVRENVLGRSRLRTRAMKMRREKRIFRGDKRKGERIEKRKRKEEIRKVNIEEGDDDDDDDDDDEEARKMRALIEDDDEEKEEKKKEEVDDDDLLTT